MKALVFYEKRDIKIEEIKGKEPRADEVLVKVKACGVCGTDIHIFNGAQGAAKTDPPTVLGHEISGIIHQTGKNVKKFKQGDRICIDPNIVCGQCYFCKNGNIQFCENLGATGVTTYGGFAEYCIVDKKQVYELPDSVSFAEAAMAEPLACCVHGMDMAGVLSGKTVLIVGGGTIGLLMLQLARISGAAITIVVEPIEAKRIIAKKLGADIILDPKQNDIKEVLYQHAIKMIDIAIECVGKKKTIEYTVESVGKGGRAILFGVASPDINIQLSPFDLFKKEVTIKTSYINPYTQARAINLIAQKRIDVKCLISDVVSLVELKNILGTDGYKGEMKLIVNPEL